ncbi:MAG: hypothetical protein B0D91_03685 [Oceanospirillales bacterium LUC14_002_19_P2]|nr:MAG: hypothetical protein B0D91_03685 [Oceanospirillales bacterium LUC14_002_19_P2]
MTTQSDKKTRNRTPQTTLAKQARRLGLSLKDIQRLTGEPYGTVKNWSQGRSRCPRSALRLLAWHRLKNWGKY